MTSSLFQSLPDAIDYYRERIKKVYFPFKRRVCSLIVSVATKKGSFKNDSGGLNFFTFQRRLRNSCSCYETGFSFPCSKCPFNYPNFFSLFCDTIKFLHWKIFLEICCQVGQDKRNLLQTFKSISVVTGIFVGKVARVIPLLLEKLTFLVEMNSIDNVS